METNYEPIIVVKDEQGNIKITEEQLREMLKQAYSNGFAAGQIFKSDNNPTIIQPTQPYISPFEYPYKTTPFWYDKFYCISTGGIVNE